MATIPLHPKLVHFPIALLIASWLFLLIAILIKNRGKQFLELYKWNLILGTIASIATLFSGFIEEKALVHNNEIHALMEIHERLGLMFTSIFIILSVWILIRKSHLNRTEVWLFVTIHFIAIVLLAYSSHLGGRMVYEQGAGVAPMEQYLIQGHEHNGGHQDHSEHDHDAHEH